ncbi:MAG: hypothetical protein HQK88_15120 [Nitrospirae bacterium]|nr:hypothetical protein [Nitrospirota bacterium]MBF0618132.1 hypothetical protein [Nitrospirota bacterium]
MTRLTSGLTRLRQGWITVSLKTSSMSGWLTILKKLG